MSELSELLERNHFRHRCSICNATKTERDTVIEERTEARAEAFRAQERVRELETLLGAWGEAQTEWWCAKKNEEAQVTIDRWGSEYHQARYRVGKAERELETAREAASRVAVEIATKRREEK